MLIVVKLYSSSGDGWSIHQCSFGGTAQSVVMLDYSENVLALERRIEEALKILGADLEAGDCVHAAYLDVSVQGMIWDAGKFGGKIPCRSIWGASERRLVAVLVLGAF
jgi:diphthine-ammonia ligase